MITRANQLAGRAVLVVCLALAALAASLAPQHFALDRNALMHGELWRLWTGHLVHGTSTHYLYDVGAAALLLLVFRAPRYAMALSPILSLAILAVLPHVDRYSGLSAGLHACAVWIALKICRESSGYRRLAALGLAFSVFAKAGVETALGKSVFTGSFDLGGPALHASHLVGASFGITIALLQGLESCSGRMRILSHVRKARLRKSQGSKPIAIRARPGTSKYQRAL